MKRTFVLFIFFSTFLLFITSSCHSPYFKKNDFDVDPIAQLADKSLSIETYPNAEIIYVLSEIKEEVFRDGRCRRITHVVFKVIHERGKDNANIEIGYNSRTETASILYAKTTTPEKKVIPLKKNAIKVVTPYKNYPSYSDYKKLVFSMPGVTVGSIVDYKIIVEEKIPHIPGEYSSSCFFQENNPVLLCRYQITLPNEMELKYFPLNPLKEFQPFPKIIPQGNKTIYLWEYKNIPQIIDEDGMPPWREVAFGLMVTTIDSWDKFFQWWRKKSEGKTMADEVIEKKAMDLTKNCSTTEGKIEAIFDYVKKQIRYVSIDLNKSGYEPAQAAEVFENKYGDCKDKSTLLISMLRAAGVAAYYVLIPTNSIGNLIKEFPYPFQFNHCIVAVGKEGQYQYIDPVGENFPVDYLPGSDQNREVLIFKDHMTLFSKTSLAKPEENGSFQKHQIKIGEEGSIDWQVKDWVTGGWEALWRWFFTKNIPSEIKEELQKSVDEDFPGVKLIDYTHSDLENFKEKFIIEMKYHSSDYCRKVGDMMIFQLPEMKKGCSAISKKERKYPLVMKNNFRMRDEIEFNIPKGYGVYYLPESMEITNPYFEFRVTYRNADDKIIYQSEHIKKAGRITPEEYPSYQRDCQAMAKKLKREVLFRLKSSQKDKP